MTVSYKLIADRAVEIIGSADPLQYETAYNTMIAETASVPVTDEVRLTEASILSGLGLVAGAAFIDKLAANLHASAIRLLQTRGINAIDPESKSAMTSLFTNLVISQTEYEWVTGHYDKTVQVWPSLKPGHVQNALEYRVRGEV